MPILLTEVSGFNPAVRQANSAWKALHTFEVIGQALSNKAVHSVFFWTSKWLGNNDLSEDVNAITSNDEITPIGKALKLWATHAGGDVFQCPDTSGLRSWGAIAKDGSYTYFALNKASHAVDVTVELIGPIKSTSITKSTTYSASSPEATSLKQLSLKLKFDNSRNVRFQLPPLSLAIVTIDGQ